MILGILRLKTSNFVDLCKDEILIYLKSIVKQTVVEYVSQVDDESLVGGGCGGGADEDGSVKLIDRVRQLRIQEFLHLLAKILSNVRTMLTRVKELIYFIVGVLNFAAGLKPPKATDEVDGLPSEELIPTEPDQSNTDIMYAIFSIMLNLAKLSFVTFGLFLFLK